MQFQDMHSRAKPTMRLAATIEVQQTRRAHAEKARPRVPRPPADVRTGPKLSPAAAGGPTVSVSPDALQICPLILSFSLPDRTPSISVVTPPSFLFSFCAFLHYTCYCVLILSSRFILFDFYLLFSVSFLHPSLRHPRPAIRCCAGGLRRRASPMIECARSVPGGASPGRFSFRLPDCDRLHGPAVNSSSSGCRIW